MTDSLNLLVPTWTDQHGRTWKVPQILGRLKPGKCAGHAALRDFVIHRDGGKCRQCAATEDLVPDHIVSRRNGGSHHPSNLQCLCRSCNSRKAGLVDAKVGRPARQNPMKGYML